MRMPCVDQQTASADRACSWPASRVQLFLPFLPSLRATTTRSWSLKQHMHLLRPAEGWRPRCHRPRLRRLRHRGGPQPRCRHHPHQAALWLQEGEPAPAVQHRQAGWWWWSCRCRELGSASAPDIALHRLSLFRWHSSGRDTRDTVLKQQFKSTADWARAKAAVTPTVSAMQQQATSSDTWARQGSINKPSCCQGMGRSGTRHVTSWSARAILHFGTVSQHP